VIEAISSGRGLAIAVLVAIVFVPPAAGILVRGVPDVPLSADFALLEIDTLHAARAAHLVGPYSRFMWRHPGPAYAYLLLPIYEVFGERSSALFLGALTINLTSALGIVAIGVALRGYGYALWSVALLALWTIAFDPRRLASIWNPHIVVFPFALLLVAAAAVAAGRVALLPVLAVVGSFLVQTHLGCLPGVALTVAVTGAMYLSRRRRTGTPAEERRWAAAALGILVLAWALPLYEQATAEHGNLQALALFIASPVRPHALAEIAPIVSGYLTALPLALVTVLVGKPPTGLDGLATGLVVFSLGLVPVAAAAARRRGQPFLQALSVTSGVVAIATYGIGTWIKGPVFDYLLLWVSAAGFALWCALGGAFASVLTDRVPARLRRSGAAVSVLLTVGVVGLATTATSRLAPPGSEDNAGGLPGAVADALVGEARGGDAPIMRIVAHDSWVPTAGIAVALYKRAIPFTVEPDWLYMFGSQFRSAARAPREILVGDRAFHEEVRSLPDRRLLVARNEAYVYLLDDPGWIDRRRWPGRARVVAVRGTTGDLAALVDGSVPAEGARWNGPGCVIVAADGFVTVAVPTGTIGGTRISADGMNAYRVLESHDGGTFAPLASLRRVGTRGMRARIVWWNDRPAPRYLRVEPQAGGNRYSIGEIEFLAQR
jgi:hypothetical protein